MKYALKYCHDNFFKIYPKSIYYGNWEQQIWKKGSLEYRKDEWQDVSYTLLIRNFYKNVIFKKNNKRFINEAFKYLLEKSKDL